MQVETRLIFLDKIDTGDNRYQISDPDPPEDLSDSIGEAGLISLPWVQQREADKAFRVVAGFRRITVCRKLGWPQLTCRVLPADASKLSGWKIAIADNAVTRSLNLLEQARAAAGLMDVCDGDTKRAAQLAGPLGLRINPELIGKLTHLLALPRAVQQAVAQNRMSLNIALNLEMMDESSAVAFAGLCQNLKPTVNHQQEIFTGLYELARLQDKSPADVLARSDFSEILHASRTDRRRQLQALRRTLYNLRFPNLSRSEAAFEQKKNNLGLPENMNISAPPAFESNVYTLTVRFSQSRQLCDCAEKLAVICRKPELEDLLDRSFNENS
jgi:hypothetical protein